MAANYLFRKSPFLNIRQFIQIQQLAQSSGMTHYEYVRQKIGTREILAHGLNGDPSYFDRPEFPMPPIRFKEDTPDIQLLREKEMGDWNKLSIEEKKTLYRVSFCQTFAEIKAPTGEWKAVMGYSLIYVALAIWVFIFMKYYVYPPLPESCSPERQKAQLQKMIDLRIEPVEGLGQLYDYEKGRWKE